MNERNAEVSIQRQSLNYLSQLQWMTSQMTQWWHLIAVETFFPADTEGKKQNYLKLGNNVK